MTIKGIDVSEHQGNIDWAKVKGNVSFVILRAGYGDAITYPNQIDRTFEKNYKDANVLLMEENFRSNAKIVDAADKFIQVRHFAILS